MRLLRRATSSSLELIRHAHARHSEEAVHTFADVCGVCILLGHLRSVFGLSADNFSKSGVDFIPQYISASHDGGSLLLRANRIGAEMVTHGCTSNAMTTSTRSLLILNFVM